MKNLFTILFTISCFLTSAADLYVFTGATAPNFSDINSAIIYSSSGDRILVAPGSYSGDVYLSSKNISIEPMAPAGEYSILGDLKVSFNENAGHEKTNVIGAIIGGNVNTNGSSNSSYYRIVNFIDCVFSGTVYLSENNIVSNYYYCEVTKETFQCNAYDVIGCDFTYNQGSSNQHFGTFQIYLGSAHNSSFVNDISNLGIDKCRVYANNFDGYYINYSWNTSYPIPYNNFHFANNNVRTRYNGTGTSNAQQIMLNSGGSNSSQFTITSTIENNSFYWDIPSISQNGWLYMNSSHTYYTVFRNNIIFNNSWTNSYHMFYFSAGNIIATINNNLFNTSIFDAGTFFSQQCYGCNNVTAVDNYNASNLNYGTTTTNFQATGVSQLPDAVDKGEDHMSCRDIDNTVNDLGTWGGPHSWQNYHPLAGSSPSSGRGRIIDIDIPHTFYGLPGVSFDIKGRAVNSNK